MLYKWTLPVLSPYVGEDVLFFLGWLRERLQTRFKVTGKPQRNVIWEYPLDAVREAIVNAVCRRNYLSAAHTHHTSWGTLVPDTLGGQMCLALQVSEAKGW